MLVQAACGILSHPSSSVSSSQSDSGSQTSADLPTESLTTPATTGSTASPTGTAAPTAKPTVKPTVRPTIKPTDKPTDQVTPTDRPTVKPTIKPTAKPVPTLAPTTTTTQKQTLPPTPVPTPVPTAVPPAATATTAPVGSDFPAKDYGTFFRDNYGQNSELYVSGDGGITIDTGSTAYGVVLVKIDTIPADKRCKVIISAGGSYQYDIIARGTFVGIPLQMGSGSYTLMVFEQVSGDSFETKMAQAFTVSLASSLKPYTAASIMSDFSRSSALVGKAGSLTSGINTQTGRVEAVYKWIIANISYDRALADSITSGNITVYLPDPNATYSSRKGICFDYASLMCAMLRSQGIPTRLIVGSTSLGYHAWNEVFFDGTGWVIVADFSWEKIDGNGWVLFDSTFAAGGFSPEKIQSIPHTKQKTY